MLYKTDGGYYHYFILAVTKRCASISPDSQCRHCEMCLGWHWYWYFASSSSLLGISVYWIFTVYTVFRERRESLGPHPSVPPSCRRGQQLQSRHAWVGRLHHPSGDHIWLIWQNHFYPKWMHTIYLSICNFKDGEYIRVNWMAIPFAMMPLASAAPILSHKWMERCKEEMYQTAAVQARAD